MSDNLNRYYVNEQGLPWALDFPGKSSWPQEGVPLSLAYPELPEWLEYGGVLPNDWWLHRNALHLFPLLAVPGLLPGGVGVLLCLLSGLGVWRLRRFPG